MPTSDQCQTFWSSKELMEFIGMLAAIAAAGVTAWMAVETRRLANAAHRSMALELAPILGVRDIFAQVFWPPADNQQKALNGIYLKIELFNAGKVTVSFRMKSLALYFANRIDRQHQTYLSRSAVVLPGSSANFSTTTLQFDPPVEKFPAVGRLSYEFEYTASGQDTWQSLSGTIEYTIGGAQQGSTFSWLYVDASPPTTSTV